MAAMRRRPVKDIETTRLAVEAIKLHHEFPSPLTESALNSAMTLYAKTFGGALAIKFQHTVLSSLWAGTPGAK